ncbi:hypothetical protein [Paenibacillus wynnii]|nr:hypothetical protein [Paenibacillus wynnii]
MEYVYTKYLDSIIVGDATLEEFQVEIGNMDYGMEIDTGEIQLKINVC